MLCKPNDEPDIIYNTLFILLEDSTGKVVSSYFAINLQTCLHKFDGFWEQISICLIDCQTKPNCNVATVSFIYEIKFKGYTKGIPTKQMMFS